jgi:uncharacterized protein
MSRENVEIVRTVLAAGDAGDWERAFSLADPEIVLDATRNVFNPATYTGIDGLREWLAAVQDVWREVRVESAEFIEAGERVVVIGRLVGTGKGSGIAVEQPNGQVWTVRGGRVVRLEIGYTDRAEVLEAVGLRDG